MKVLNELSLFVIQVFVVLAVYGDDSKEREHEWNYDNDGEIGPSKWYNLQGFKACSGYNQSPVNIKTRRTWPVYKRLRFFNYESYTTKSVTMWNSGHSVEIEFEYEKDTGIDCMPHITGGLLTDNYYLVNVHFHWGSVSSRGSEHTINGNRYPMEVHLVHIKSTYSSLEVAREHADGVSIIGSMFSISSFDNTYLTSLLDNIKTVTFKDMKRQIDSFNLYDILPDNYDYFYTYMGSLTTPPCSESVIWIVFLTPAKISEKQIQVFRDLSEENIDSDRCKPLVDNFRELEHLNGRTIYWKSQ